MSIELKLIKLLRDEMVLALGCTEPISIAYASSLVTKYLAHKPESLLAQCSANMVKNVKSVIVPNSGGMKGISVACLLGAYFGCSDKKLEVLSDITPEQIEQCQRLIPQIPCSIELLESHTTLHIIITGKYKNDTVSVEIRDGHTNVVSIIRNGEQLCSQLDEIDNNPQDSHSINGITLQDIKHVSRYSDYTSLIDLLDQERRC